MNDQTTTISQLKILIQEFRTKRGWTQEDPKDVALSLVLESAELLEHFQWIAGEDVLKNEKIKEAIGEEMSDVLWWLINLGQRLDIDVAGAFEKKIVKNAKKYPEHVFTPNTTQEEKMRQYYKIKAETRGGHPLYTPPEEEKT
ncbi:MAG TPA: nucleotide pyrophosphohydrolase [Patescibacteria group bacterium]|nr:nucleotide pyrophosphohydrolase [Patescibacteria group bacterium]